MPADLLYRLAMQQLLNTDEPQSGETTPLLERTRDEQEARLRLVQRCQEQQLPERNHHRLLRDLFPDSPDGIDYSFVYLMRLEDKPEGTYKIGKTNDLEVRRMQHEKSYGCALTLIKSYPTVAASELEQATLRHFKRLRDLGGVRSGLHALTDTW